jgi:hypothetical protein
VTDVLERIGALPCSPRGLRNRERRIAGIEDYLFIGGGK